MMKKRIVSMVLLSALAATALSGCGSAQGTGGKLYVYNWGEYIDEDVITDF